MIIIIIRYANENKKAHSAIHKLDCKILDPSNVPNVITRKLPVLKFHLYPLGAVLYFTRQGAVMPTHGSASDQSHYRDMIRLVIYS